VRKFGVVYNSDMKRSAFTSAHQFQHARFVIFLSGYVLIPLITSYWFLISEKGEGKNDV
jgi:uncharacterized membrane protein